MKDHKRYTLARELINIYLCIKFNNKKKKKKKAEVIRTSDKQSPRNPQ